MARIIGCLLILGTFLVGILGCSDTSSQKQEKTVTTPEGETKVTTEEKVEKSGESPPPANP